MILFLFLFNMFSQNATVPSDSWTLGSDVLQTKQQIESMLNAVRQNNQNASGIDCDNPQNPTERDFCNKENTQLEQDLENMLQNYTGFLGDMKGLSHELNTIPGQANTSYGQNIDINETCSYCSGIPDNNNPYSDILSPYFLNIAQTSADSIKKSNLDNVEDKILNEETMGYKNLIEDYKKGDLISVYTNDKYKTVTDLAAQSFLAKLRLSLVSMKEKPKELLEIYKEINKDDLIASFNSKVLYGANKQYEYVRRHSGKNRLLRDKTIDGYYASGIDLFAVIHRNYYIRRMAGLFLTSSKLE